MHRHEHTTLKREHLPGVASLPVLERLHRLTPPCSLPATATAQAFPPVSDLPRQQIEPPCGSCSCAVAGQPSPGSHARQGIGRALPGWRGTWQVLRQ
ncbi:hypothetical protein JYG34_12055 [Pseudomonas entomophila]|uniref:hypothetical protein n=1 Tax=Pseudomonas entomophila TaxID=312306 RepID=UPI001BCB5328|nr:hypothetical protein [Pseudomonas entomophila]QVM93701.1 hypothetical protein JYG34_12055 [Pseudomonas entomophila]